MEVAVVGVRWPVARDLVTRVLSPGVCVDRSEGCRGTGMEAGS